MRQLDQHGDADQGDDHRKAPERVQRTDRIGAPKLEFATPLGRQGFLQHHKAEQRIGEREGGRDEERRAGAPMIADDAAECRPDDEADAEGRARQSEIRRALLGRRHVRDIGVDRRVGRARDARQEASDEQPGDGRRRARDRIIDRERDQRDDEHGPAAEAVAQVSDRRRAQELHQRIDEQQPAAPARRPAQALARQLFDDGGRDRDDDAQPDRVDQHGREDEGQRIPAGQRPRVLAHPTPFPRDHVKFRWARDYSRSRSLFVQRPCASQATARMGAPHGVAMQIFKRGG